MEYISFKFLFFLIIIWVLFCLVKSQRRNIILIGSLLFIASYGWLSLGVFLFVFIISYLFSRWRHKSVLGKNVIIGILLGCLLLYKIYLGTGFKETFTFVGVSYYILKAISFVRQSYSDSIEDKSDTSLLEYMLYLSYFPCIVQGPIQSYKEFKRTIGRCKFVITSDNLGNGIMFVLVGLVKKLVVADRLGVYVTWTFDGYRELPSYLIYLAILAFSFQIYFDFAGCVDICRGISNLFGIELPENFANPYMSESYKEFWGRWHITFSNWLKNNVYIPLGGNEHKYRNIFIVFAFSGLWHGLSLGYLTWGIGHAILRILEDIVSKHSKYKLNIYVKRVCIFHCVSVLWIFFSNREFGYCIDLLAALIRNGLHSSGLRGINYVSLIIPICCVIIHIIVICLIEKKYKITSDVIKHVSQYSSIYKIVLATFMVLDIIIMGNYGVEVGISSFMYGMY